jgi:hypothetical protein
VKLLLVSLDFKESFPDKISNFADKRKFTSPIVWLDETNADYFCPKVDNKWSGVMPRHYLSTIKKGIAAFLKKRCQKKNLNRRSGRFWNDQ